MLFCCRSKNLSMTLSEDLRIGCLFTIPSLAFLCSPFSLSGIIPLEKCFCIRSFIIKTLGKEQPMLLSEAWAAPFILIPDDNESLARLSSNYWLWWFPSLEHLLSRRLLAGCWASAKMRPVCSWLYLIVCWSLTTAKCNLLILYLKILSWREIKQFSLRHTSS